MICPAHPAERLPRCLGYGKYILDDVWVNLSGNLASILPGSACCLEIFYVGHSCPMGVDGLPEFFKKACYGYLHTAESLTPRRKESAPAEMLP